MHPPQPVPLTAERIPASSAQPVRHRQRPQRPEASTPSPAAPETTAGRHDNPRVALLREVQMMTARGRPQADIAAHFGVDDRTVRRWLAEARQKELGTFRQTTAEEVLAESEFVYATLKATLLAKLEAAAAAGDYRSTVAISRELRAIEWDRFGVREKMGLMGNLVFNALPAEPEPDPFPMSPDMLRMVRSAAQALEAAEEREERRARRGAAGR